MLNLLKKHRKQITTRSMPIHLCMPLGLKSLSRTLHIRKGKKANWISDGFALLHHEEFGERDTPLMRESTLKEKKVNGAHIKPYIASSNIQPTADILSTCATNSLGCSSKDNGAMS